MTIKSTSRLIFLIIALSLTSGCSTYHLSTIVNDKKVKSKSYFKDIKGAYILDETIALKLERKTDSNVKSERSTEFVFLCFEKDDIENSMMLFLYNKDSKAYQCEENVFKNRKPVLRLNRELEQELKKSFLISDLEIYIKEGIYNSIDTRCDCDLLKEVTSKPEKIFSFNESLFYIKLEDGSWLRFTKSKHESLLTFFTVSFADTTTFENEKKEFDNQIKEIDFSKRYIKERKHLFVSLDSSLNKVYVYRIPAEANIEDRLTSVVIKDDVIRDEYIKESEYKHLKYLYPVTIALDVLTVTEPIWELLVIWSLYPKIVDGAYQNK